MLRKYIVVLSTATKRAETEKLPKCVSMRQTWQPRRRLMMT